LDEHSREWLAIQVKRKLNSSEAARRRQPLFLFGGLSNLSSNDLSPNFENWFAFDFILNDTFIPQDFIIFVAHLAVVDRRLLNSFDDAKGFLAFHDFCFFSFDWLCCTNRVKDVLPLTPDALILRAQ